MNKHLQEVIKLKLNYLFNERSSFDICTVRSMAELLNVNAERHPDFKLLKELHCIAYTEISEDLKNDLPSMVMNCLSHRFDADIMSKALLAIHNGEISNQTDIEDLPPPDIKKLAFFKRKEK